jgi:glycosyltransferase involved in cell wall biosynthesis
MTRPLDVLFFTASLGGGGAEKHTQRLVNQIGRGQFRVQVALARRGGAYESELSPDIPVHILGTERLASLTLRLRRLLQAQQPDVLCSVMDHMNVVAILAALGCRRPPRVIANVQVSPTNAYRGPWHTRRQVLLSLLPRLYPRASRVVALSHGVADDLRGLAPTLAGRISVIYNAGLDDSVRAGAAEPLDLPLPDSERPLLVACGRLTRQKGYPYLLEAFARLQQLIPSQLWIVGEGEDRPLLERQIRQSNLGDRVRLLGFQHNPYKYMAAADVFVLSSLWEGFGNVIVEAMACGSPVVATDCPHGPAEIITQDVNGLLVPPADAAALTEAIARVLRDGELRRRLSQNGQLRALDFAAPAVAAQYEALLQQVTNTPFIDNSEVQAYVRHLR